MKIWYQHGSEHSANLVMIGRFADAADATRAKEIIDALTAQVAEDLASGTLRLGDPPVRYGQAILDLLARLNIGAIGPGELEQFGYEVNVQLNDKDVVLTTEEFEISAFLKVMFLQRARIEVYSAHDYPDSEHGRGRR